MHCGCMGFIYFNEVLIISMKYTVTVQKVKINGLNPQGSCILWINGAVDVALLLITPITISLPPTVNTVLKSLTINDSQHYAVNIGSLLKALCV